MKKVIIIFICLNTLFLGAIQPSIKSFEKKLLKKDQPHLQKVANLLRIFISKTPQEEEFLLKQASDDDIATAKRDALKIIQKACGPLLDKPSAEKTENSLKMQEITLNEWYKKIISKLSVRYNKILYGPDAGAPLPHYLTLIR